MAGYYLYPFFSTTTPKGGLVVFMHQYFPDPRPPGPPSDFTSTGSHGTVRTSVVYVNRSGRIGSALLDFSVEAGSSCTPNEGWRTAGRGYMQVVFGADGVMHCFLSDIHAQGYYARLALREGRLSVIDTVRIDFSRKVAPDGTISAVTDRQQLLWWMHDEKIRAATQILGRDTLLVVEASDSREYDRSFGSTIPGGTISSYRFKLPGLSLIDSVSAKDSNVAGVSSVGKYPRRATLVRTRQGMVFYLPYPQGMCSYVLDGTGKPIPGTRTEAPVRSPSGFGATGTQFLEFAQPGYLRPWVMEWFGLDDAGNAYYDVHRTESIPGRIR
jgi:hypothetical protein